MPLSQWEVLHWQPPSSNNPTHCAPTSHKAIPNGNQYEDGRKRKSYWGNELQEEMEGKGKGDCCCRLLAHSLTQLLTQLILFLPEMSNRSSYSPDNTCWLGRATTRMPPDLCNFSEICRGSKVTVRIWFIKYHANQTSKDAYLMKWIGQCLETECMIRNHKWPLAIRLQTIHKPWVALDCGAVSAPLCSTKKEEHFSKFKIREQEREEGERHSFHSNANYRATGSCLVDLGTWTLEADRDELHHRLFPMLFRKNEASINFFLFFRP